MSGYRGVVPQPAVPPLARAFRGSMADRFPEVPRAAARRVQSGGLARLRGPSGHRGVENRRGPRPDHRKLPYDTDRQARRVAISGMRAAPHARSRRLVPPAACRQAWADSPFFYPARVVVHRAVTGSRAMLFGMADLLVIAGIIVFVAAMLALIRGLERI